MASGSGAGPGLVGIAKSLPIPRKRRRQLFALRESRWGSLDHNAPSFSPDSFQVDLIYGGVGCDQVVKELPQGDVRVAGVRVFLSLVIYLGHRV